MSITNIVTPISALTYPAAIVLPKSDSDAKGLIRLSLYVALIMAAFMALVLVLFNRSLVHYLQIDSISPYLFLIPLGMVWATWMQVAQQWLIRKKHFNVRAKVAVMQAFLINSIKVCAGLFYPVPIVLVFVATFGSLIHALMLSLGICKMSGREKKHVADETSSVSISYLATSYRDFPLFRGPQVFINMLSRSLPVLMLFSFFGPAAAGFYSIGKTVLGLPTMLIGQSVTDVFYTRITHAAREGENLRALLIKATFTMAIVGFVPFFIVIVFGPWIFGFVFGSEWVTAGNYARWLALWSFFGFLNSPAVSAIPVIKMQGKFLVYEVVSVSLRALTLLCSFYIFGSDIYAVALFSLVSAILNIYLIAFVITMANEKGRHNERLYFFVKTKTAREVD
jgi:O-antigen/teichoic acid export membrane protein